MTAAFWLPGLEGGGIHEDSIDSLVQIGNSTALVVLCLVFVLAVLCFNIFGMKITQMTHSVSHRLSCRYLALVVFVCAMCCVFAVSVHAAQVARSEAIPFSSTSSFIL